MRLSKYDAGGWQETNAGLNGGTFAHPLKVLSAIINNSFSGISDVTSAKTAIYHGARIS